MMCSVPARCVVQEPVVSVIMPTYNRAGWLHSSIGSVMQQTYQNWQLIVWDDGSSDHTGALVRSLGDKRITYCRDTNHGVSYARNRAMEVSTGEYIAFLDSDDEWVPTKLSSQIAILESNPSIDMIFGNFSNRNVLTGQDGSWFELKAHGLAHLRTVRLCDNALLITGGMPESLLVANFIATDSVVVRRGAMAKAGYFREELRNAEDFELWWRMSLGDGKFAYIEDVVLIRNWLPSGLSRQSVAACKSELLRLDRCIEAALRCNRRDLTRGLDAHYRRGWRALMQQYALEGDWSSALGALGSSLRYGISPHTVWQLIVIMTRSKTVPSNGKG